MKKLKVRLIMPEQYDQEDLDYVYNLPDKSLREELLKVMKELRNTKPRKIIYRPIRGQESVLF